MKKLIIQLILRTSVMLGGSAIIDIARNHFVVANYRLFEATYETSRKITAIENTLDFTGFIFIALCAYGIIETSTKIMKKIIDKK